TIRMEAAVPLVHAALRGGFRELRIEGEEEYLFGREAFQLGDGGAGERVPVAHGYDYPCVQVAAEGRFQGGGLASREIQDGRLAADFGVVMRYFFGARRGDELGQRLAGYAR